MRIADDSFVSHHAQCSQYAGSSAILHSWTKAEQHYQPNGPIERSLLLRRSIESQMKTRTVIIFL